MKCRSGTTVLLACFVGCWLWLASLVGPENAARAQQVTKQVTKTEQVKKDAVPRPIPPPLASQPVSPTIAQPGGPVFNVTPDQPVVFSGGMVVGSRFTFKIDPKTPIKDLLPTRPSDPLPAGPFLGEDLTKVPEVSFQQPVAKSPKAMEEIAHTMARINHVNQKKSDAYMEALIASRPDLSGMPFTLGDACRMKAQRTPAFLNSLTRVRKNMNTQLSVTVADASKAPQQAADTFWNQFQMQSVQEDRAGTNDDVVRARIAALMQVLGPDSAAMRQGLVKHLAAIPHVEATRALAKLAIFSAEEEVQTAAIDALKIRRDKDYTDILLQGLRYPLPAVAERTARAIVKLERSDLISQLVAFLDEPDPRAPVTKVIDDKPTPVVHELVRINHHRNCLLCHAPEQSRNVAFTNSIAAPGMPGPGPGSAASPPVPAPPRPADVKEPQIRAEQLMALKNAQVLRAKGFPAPATITAQVPVPGEPFPTPSQGYDNSIPDILVRIDATYLRQDFSLMQKVADAHPWPEMQRFDFLVRTRTLTPEQEQAYRDEIQKSEAAGKTPYRQATLLALRSLTGRDAGTTAQAWRSALKLQ
jgi:hypothetical protein